MMKLCLPEHHVRPVLLGAAGGHDHRAGAGAHPGRDLGPGQFLDEDGVGAGGGVGGRRDDLLGGGRGGEEENEGDQGSGHRRSGRIVHVLRAVWRARIPDRKCDTQSDTGHLGVPTDRMARRLGTPASAGTARRRRAAARNSSAEMAQRLGAPASAGTARRRRAAARTSSVEMGHRPGNPPHGDLLFRCAPRSGCRLKPALQAVRAYSGAVPPAAWKASTMRFWRRRARPTMTVARIAKTNTR